MGTLNRPVLLESNFFDTSALHDSLEYDGAINIPAACVPRDNSSIFTVRFGQHFENDQPGLLILRRDENGLYSYKHFFGYIACGQRQQILNIDFSGKPITDPEKADFAGLDQFGGYWAIPYDGIPYKPAVNIDLSLGFGKPQPAPQPF